MGYTVKDLLESNRFPEMHLISGSAGIDREIKKPWLIEMEDMEKFLVGGEFLMTSMKAYKDIDEHAFLHHLEEFNKKNISGFIVKRCHETKLQERLFDILLQFAEEHNLPVLEIPTNMYFWGIIKYMLLQLYDIETAKLIYFKTTHDSLSRILLDKQDSKTVTTNLLFQIDTILGNPVALYNGESICYASTAPGMSEFKKEEDCVAYTPNIITRYEYLRQKREHVEYIKKMDVFEQRDICLVISERNEPLRELDFIALENIIVTLEYILVRCVIEEDIEKKYHRDLQYRLLNGSLTNVEEDEVADILNLNESDDFQVITFHMASKNNEGRFSDKQLKETKNAEKELMHLLPKDYVFSNTNQIIYIHKEDGKENKLEFRKRLEKLQQRVQEDFVKKQMDIDFLIGIGKSVKGYHFLKESFRSSKMAIKYINVIRKTIGDKDKAVVDISKLGFFSYMMAKVEDKEELYAFVPESLQKLHQHDAEKNGELIDTLECFLNNNQSIKKTSQLMFVHYRTVSYRIQKIVEITGMDFSNVTEMLVVRNGLLVLRVLEEM